MIARAHRVLRGLGTLYPLFLLLVAWQIAAELRLTPPLFLPAFSSVLAQMQELLFDGGIIMPLVTSLYRALAGFLLALLVGTALGFAMAQMRWLRWLLNPLVTVGFPAPKIAFIPMFILWLGIGDQSKIALVAFNTVFPFIVSSYAGARTVPVNQIWAAQAMGETKLGLLWRVIFPAALPLLMSGFRIGVPIALLTTFTAEMIAGGGGLGGGEVMAERYFESPTVYAYLMVMLAVGYAIDVGCMRLRRAILCWHDEKGGT